MAIISASVGKGGVNRNTDVKTVQRLINQQTNILPQLINDGICGNKTIQAINKLQAALSIRQDGRVDPNGGTLRRLNQGGAKININNAAAAVPPVATNSNWSGDSSQWSDEKKLLSMKPDMRTKVSNVLAALTKRGFQPRIVYGWRSVAVQKELVRKGNSKVSFSFHNAQHSNGTPNSYAADVIDKRWAWNVTAEQNGFWDALGEEAKKQGLYWGGDWKSFKDVAHIQLVANSQLSQVKKESGL